MEERRAATILEVDLGAHACECVRRYSKISYDEKRRILVESELRVANKSTTEVHMPSVDSMANVPSSNQVLTHWSWDLFWTLGTDDMELDEETETYSHTCRCSGSYVITADQLSEVCAEREGGGSRGRGCHIICWRAVWSL